MPKVDRQVVRDYRGRECLTLAEAARRLKLSKEAVRQAIERGALHVTVVGPHLHLVTVESLGRYRLQRIEARKQQRRRRRRAAA